MDNNNKLLDQPKSVGPDDGITSKTPELTSKDISDNEIRKQLIERQEHKEQRGWVGKFWGEGDHAAKNIAGILICFLGVVGAAYTYGTFESNNPCSTQIISDFWKILTPLITLALGYLFGNSAK